MFKLISVLLKLKKIMYLEYFGAKVLSKFVQLQLLNQTIQKALWAWWE